MRAPISLIALIAIAVALLSASAGCHTVNVQVPGTLRSDVKPTETESVGRLDIRKDHWFFFWGLLGQPPPDFFAAEIKAQVQKRGGHGVAELTYESQFTCGDLLIGLVTCGIVGPKSYTMTGEIVRIRAEPLPGKPVVAQGY